MTRLSSVRAGAAAAGLLLVFIALWTARSGDPTAPATRASLARLLSPSTTAVRIPHTWLVAGPPRLVAGDHVDVLGSRSGDRSSVLNLALEARVLEPEGDALVLEVAPDDAAALAAARVSGYLMFVVLRGAP